MKVDKSRSVCVVTFGTYFGDFGEPTDFNLGGLIGHFGYLRRSTEVNLG